VAVRTHVSGAMDDDTSDAALDALLDELETSDAEHPDVSVKHESEWCVSVGCTGRVVWENVEEGEPRHMEGVPRQEARRLLGLVARGELAEVERQNWLPGYHA
jgi:hypothetical protein